MLMVHIKNLRVSLNELNPFAEMVSSMYGWFSQKKLHKDFVDYLL